MNHIKQLHTIAKKAEKWLAPYLQKTEVTFEEKQEAMDLAEELFVGIAEIVWEINDAIIQKEELQPEPTAEDEKVLTREETAIEYIKERKLSVSSIQRLSPKLRPWGIFKTSTRKIAEALDIETEWMNEKEIAQAIHKTIFSSSSTKPWTSNTSQREQ